MIPMTYEEWLKSHSLEVQINEVECDECGGDGKIECYHCGSLMECGKCQGSGKVKNDLTLDLYNEQRRKDKKQLASYPLLSPSFI